MATKIGQTRKMGMWKQNRHKQRSSEILRTTKNTPIQKHKTRIWNRQSKLEKGRIRTRQKKIHVGKKDEEYMSRRRQLNMDTDYNIHVSKEENTSLKTSSDEDTNRLWIKNTT